MSKRKQSNHNAKKAAVLKSEKSNMKPLTLVLGAAVVFITTAIAFYVTGATTAPSTPSNTTSSANTVSTGDAGTSQVSYPVSMFADGKARHFELKADELTVRYFILQSSDGVIRAAFDACDVCWPAGKGYYQEGDDMVCRNCGRRFASVLVNEVKGGCNPAPLNRKVQGDQLILKVEDILIGKSYFNFKEKV
jgi:uncharacterized membrane protein